MMVPINSTLSLLTAEYMLIKKIVYINPLVDGADKLTLASVELLKVH